MNADHVINQMACRYANCQTYQDTGRVEGGQGDMIFSTWFVRPDLFRFDWNYLKEPGRNYIWSDGLKVFSKNYYGPGVYKEGNLGLAIASATGLSQGAAQTVPTLLMPDANSGLDSRTLLERFPYESCVIEIEAGESCYKVCSTGTKRLDELWISMNDFAVRRYREKSTFIPEYCERTIAAMVPFDAAEAEEFRQRLHVNNCTWYERVVFDEPIDQAVFNGPAD